MSDNTKIEWTDATWSPVTGCTKVSPACDHCYIDRTPPLRMARRKFDGTGPGATTGVLLHPERLSVPMRWKRGRRIFVCSLADLFHDEVPDDYIADVFGVMAHATQHTFQVLTKRHARLRSLLGSAEFKDAVADRILRDDKSARARWAAQNWPLRNVWLGVTAESQEWFNIRALFLASTPAAVRFVSAEPLLGPIELGIHRRDLGWVITGGESGPGARPSHPDWFRDLRDQCGDNGIAYFHKQHGEWAEAPTVGGGALHDVCMSYNGDRYDVDADYVCAPNESDGIWLRRLGKKSSGRELDGKTWSQFPAVAS